VTGGPITGDPMTGVSVAVLSWNGRKHLEACLPALAAQADPGVPWEVLVLDNGSQDGTAAWVRAEHPWVRVVESPVNLGFCAGNNRLVREAAHDGVAFLNNDTRPEPGWLAALVAALASAAPDVAAVSGQIVDWEGERLDFGRGVMTFDGHGFQLDFRRPLEEAVIPDEGEELLFACGGNMLIRRDSFLEAGGFDEDYFAYLEDVDLGWRLWLGGERIVFTPDARVRHRSSATSDLLGLHNRGFLFERNAFLTVFKNYEEDLWRRLMPAVLLTFNSRTQCLLVYANPGGDTLTVDPYAGHIADTGGPGAAGPAPGVATPPAAPVPAGGGVASRLADRARDLLSKWRRFGTGEMARRAVRKLERRLGDGVGGPGGGGSPVLLHDERTVAQLRAQNYLLGHLESAAEKRRAVQARRQRSDREIFERFPLYLVPTYPGDDDLFGDPGFEAWLPDDVPLIRRRLDEVMELGED
jgi:GT2 family glycosyltransferase